MYTNCSSTELVDILDCTFSCESITIVVSATADANATRIIELDTGGAEDLRRRDVRFSSAEADSDTELEVIAAGVGLTLEISAVNELVTVVGVGGCSPLGEMALDITGKLAFTATSTLEIDVSTFESPAVVCGRGFEFGVIDTVNDGSVNNFNDSNTVFDEPGAPDA